MCMERRMLYIGPFQIDTNLINARQRIEAVNRLEQWCKDEIIIINMSATAQSEAQAGEDACRRRKANEQIFTMTPPVDQNDPLFKRVEGVLFPDGASDENQLNDVRIVAEAAKYHAILVTNDGASKTQPGGILGNRHKLAGLVQIMSPDEAVIFVRSKIQERDEFNRRIAKQVGGELPAWTGQDDA
jgi:hypothetical protein